MTSIPFFRSARLTAATLVFLLGFAVSSVADDARVQGSLAASIRTAISNWAPEQLPVIADAQSEWSDAADALHEYFARPENTDVADAWLTFLDLKTLGEAIESNASVGKRGAEAVRLSQRLTGLHPGLELQAIQRLRDATSSLINALRFADPQRSERILRGQLEAIATSLEKGPAETDPAESDDASILASNQDRMSVLMQSLLAANQNPELVAQIQGCYGKPNLRIAVSQSAIDELTALPIDDNRPVRECILGSSMVGDSRLIARVSTQLLPHDHHVRLLLRMDGRFNTRSRSYRKPVSVDSTANTNVYVARQVIVTEQKTHLGPVIAQVDLKSQIHRVNHPLKLVRRIAHTKAIEAKPQAEAISSGRLKKRLIDDFQRRSDSQLSRTFPSIDKEVGPWLERLGLASITRHLSSTADHAQMVASVSAKSGLRAPSVAPPLTSVSPGFQIAFQIHESVATCIADSMLAGESLSPDRVRQIATEIGFDPSNAPESGGDLGEFEVDFASTRPAFFEARDQSLRLGFRATRFSSEGRELESLMQIVAVYRPAMVDGHFRLIRDQDLDITFPGTRRLSIPQTAIKANMVQVMDDVFPQELLKRQLMVPADASTRLLAGREFLVDKIDLQDGWATITLRIKPGNGSSVDSATLATVQQ